MIRAKFVVETVTQHRGSIIDPKTGLAVPGAHPCTVQLNPVYSDDKNSENGKFYAATPGGSITLSWVRPEVAAQFEVGKAYYIDFTPASE